MQPAYVFASAVLLVANAFGRGAEVGAPVPDFTLHDLEGRPHRLAEQRGRIVVLEWTNHVCPSAIQAQESGVLADTRAALDPERVVWWQVDSSWFAPELAESVAGWRARLALAVPYLLDTEGKVAQSLGASATPQLFVVDAGGRLAYAGGLHDGGPEAVRKNHVLEAVHALLAGKTVPVPETAAQGCRIALREGEAPASVTLADVDEDAAARALARRAVEAAEAGTMDAAVGLLGEALEAGLPNPWSLVADPGLQGLFASREARHDVHALLAERPARGALLLVAPGPQGEPGEPLVLAGTVRDEAGAPIPGAVVSLYHTDAAGWYSVGELRNSTRGDDPRLYGRVATNREGRYRVRTIMPGAYADGRGGQSGPLHIHMETSAEGFRPCAGHPASVYFDDDPGLTGATREEIVGDGCFVLERTRNAEGIQLCVHDITLQRE